MKREGRQHGFVRTYRFLPNPLNPRLNTRIVNRFESPATAGSFTRVSSKPTNHSKFTGKCGQPRCNGCHLSPTCKAKNKTKGNHKIRSNNDVDSGHSRLSLSGNSAARILDQLASDYDHHDFDEDDDPTVDI